VVYGEEWISFQTGYPVLLGSGHKIEFHKIEIHKIEYHKIEYHKIESYKIEISIFHKIEYHKIEYHKIEFHNIEISIFHKAESFSKSFNKIESLIFHKMYLRLIFSNTSQELVMRLPFSNIFIKIESLKKGNSELLELRLLETGFLSRFQLNP
jgi:hypothetical protein